MNRTYVMEPPWFFSDNKGRYWNGRHWTSTQPYKVGRHERCFYPVWEDLACEKPAGHKGGVHIVYSVGPPFPAALTLDK